MALHILLERVQRGRNNLEHEGMSEKLAEVKEASELTLNPHFQRQGTATKHPTLL